MIRLSCEIVVGRFKMDFCHKVEVETGFEQLTSLARITLPRKLQWQGKPIIEGSNGVFKVGDQVTIKLGYNGINSLVFSGYLRKVETKTPIVLHCEDEMYKLKQKPVEAYSEKNATLEGLLNSIAGMPVVATSLKLGRFRASKSTVAKVLEHLAENYKVSAWIRDGKLYAGLPYSVALENTVEGNFDFEKNIIGDTLEYKSESEIKLKAKAISLNDDNSKLEVEVGESGGEERTLYFYNIDDKATLKKMAEEDLKKLIYEGYSGEFDTFGFPLVKFVRFGDYAVIAENKKLGRQGGKYLIEKVTYTFGVGGFRQKIKLGRKV